MSDACTVDQLIKPIEEMAPLIEADSPAFDRTRQITAPVVAAMHDINLFNLWQPHELDGPALNLTDTTRVLEALAQIDGLRLGVLVSLLRTAGWEPSCRAKRLEESLLMNVRSSLARFSVDRLRRQAMATLCLGACHSQVGSAIVPGAIGGAVIFRQGQPKLTERGHQEVCALPQPVRSRC